jgi:type II secretory pathway pseudopilin PulG
VARHPFGLNAADFAVVAGTGNTAVFTPGSTITFWNAQVGGTQYTALAANADGTSPIDHTTSATGTDGYTAGQLIPFWGPDTTPDTLGMWASGDGGPRFWVLARDIADVAAAAQAQAAAVVTALSNHQTANNPHGTGLANLADVSIPTKPTNGSGLFYDLADDKWKAVTSTGLNPADFVKTVGGSQIRVPNGDVTTRGLQIFIPAGDRAAAPNTMSFWWNAGTDGSPNWQETTRFNEYGETRLQASRNDRIALRIKQVDGSQTGNLTEWVNNSNAVLSYVGPSGLVRSPNLGSAPFLFSISGTISTGTGAHRIYNDTGVPLTIRAVRAAVGTAPTGASLLVDVNINGTTIFTTQTNRPTITASTFTAAAAAINTTTIAPGDYLTVDVDQVGSTIAGSNLTVAIWAY